MALSSLERKQLNRVLQRTKPVYAVYTSSSGAVIPAIGGIVDYGTRVLDSHNAVTTGASWRWTCPVNCDGLYVVHAALSNTGGASSLLNIELAVNNSTLYFLGRNEGTSGIYIVNGRSPPLSLVAGDYLHLVAADSGGKSQWTDARLNHISIMRVNSLD
jgi:hypothetical protein